ncbi:hypothetical protein AVEN_232966-1 [Araneus ventricosus]|uniref:Uncharacterized protein n=1 Tax=Araneus ventricosus TaxID=182803 RepID=A0A4Y2SM70_ARAVE|nr:hypothetical protein AVEN_254665-1 [Araneus ventricosus]GBN88377.1 hypothetical protein AVEN_232966-1 [Araneus ventricosus]
MASFGELAVKCVSGAFVYIAFLVEVAALSASAIIGIPVLLNYVGLSRLGPRRGSWAAKMRSKIMRGEAPRGSQFMYGCMQSVGRRGHFKICEKILITALCTLIALICNSVFSYLF